MTYAFRVREENNSGLILSTSYIANFVLSPKSVDMRFEVFQSALLLLPKYQIIPVPVSSICTSNAFAAVDAPQKLCTPTNKYVLINSPPALNGRR